MQDSVESQTPGFENQAHSDHRQVFGVDYVRQNFPEGELFLTRYGWPLRQILAPEKWYTGRQFARRGARLRAGTGMVYRVPVNHPIQPRLSLVVKFSRFAQDVPLRVSTEIREYIPPAIAENAHFNGPFEEIGLLMDLRQSHQNQNARRMLTKRPLGIFVPHKEYPAWQIGRSDSLFYVRKRLQQLDQNGVPPSQRVPLLRNRLYVLLFEWIHGEDAYACFQKQLISELDMTRLTFTAIEELSVLGFRMLDIKPHHLILRPSSLKYFSQYSPESWPYALIDFELLQRHEVCGVQY